MAIFWLKRLYVVVCPLCVCWHLAALCGSSIWQNNISSCLKSAQQDMRYEMHWKGEESRLVRVTEFQAIKWVQLPRSLNIWKFWSSLQCTTFAACDISCAEGSLAFWYNYGRWLDKLAGGRVVIARKGLSLRKGQWGAVPFLCSNKLLDQMVHHAHYSSSHGHMVVGRVLTGL